MPSEPLFLSIRNDFQMSEGDIDLAHSRVAHFNDSKLA